jgi:hypothetical protein
MQKLKLMSIFTHEFIVFYLLSKCFISNDSSNSTANTTGSADLCRRRETGDQEHASIDYESQKSRKQSKEHASGSGRNAAMSSFLGRRFLVIRKGRGRDCDGYR